MRLGGVGEDESDASGSSTTVDRRVARHPRRGVCRRAFLGAFSGVAAGMAGCLTVSKQSGSISERAPTVAASDRDTGQFEFPPDHCRTPADRTDSDPLAVEFDSRGRFRCAGTLLDGMEDLSHWDTYEGTIEPDLDRFRSGTQSARLETDSPDGRVWTFRRFEPGLDLEDDDLSIAIHPGHGDTKAKMLRVQLLAPDYVNRIDMRHGIGGLGGWLRMDLGPTVIKGEPDLGDVREIRIQSLKGSQPRLRLNVDELRLVPKAERGRVMFTFDDIPLSQYATGFPVMNEYGFPGVAGAIPWLTEDEHFISRSQLQEMQEAGWDVVSHPQLTDPSTPLPAISKERQHETIRRSKRWLVDNGFEGGARFIIWPFHAAGSATLSIASRYHYLGFAGGRSPSGIPATDTLTIGRVNGEYADGAVKMVSYAERFRQLTVIMFHQIGRGQLPVDEFERILRAVDRADVEVVTATDLWALMNQ